MRRRRRVRVACCALDDGAGSLTLVEDPNAPKRGLSAYMFFANEQRENVRDENPGITFGETG